MRRYLLAASTAAALAALTGCGKKTSAPPACVQVIAQFHKLATCEKLPAASRKTIEEQTATLEKAIGQIEDYSDVPADQLKILADTCTSQGEAVKKAIGGVAPECN